MFFSAIAGVIFTVVFVVFLYEVYKKLDHDWRLYMQIPGPKPRIFFGNALEIPPTQAITGVILTVVLIVFLYEVYKKFDHGWQVYMQLPGPEPRIFFGNVLEIPPTQVGLFQYDKKMVKIYPKTYRHQMVNVKSVLCFNAEDVEYFIAGPATTIKDFPYNFIIPWVRTGLLTSTGDKWQTRRKMITPAFHFNILQGFLKIFHEQTKELVSTLKKHCHAEYLNVIPFISDFSLNSINDTAMGVKPSELQGGDAYKHAVDQLIEMLVPRMMKPWFYSDFVFQFTSTYKKQKNLLKTLHSYTNNVISMREKSFDGWTNFQNQDDVSPYSKKKRMAMLDLLLSEKEKGLIDYEGIHEEVDTFMFEGHDTVSTAICYTLLVLANYKDVQENIRKEIFEVIGDKENPTIDELNQLKYMERCIKEVLRLYPSVPYIFRITTKEGTSESGRTFPKGLLVCIEIINLHYDPDVFPDPEKFDPDRFLPENCKDRHPFAYIPFSAGPRNCIGQRFALLEMKAVLCGILREFNLEPIHKREDIILKVNIILRSDQDGIRVKFVPRKNKSKLIVSH